MKKISFLIIAVLSITFLQAQTIYTSSDVFPIYVPDYDFRTSTIVVSDLYSINDINVFADVSSTWIQDVRLDLQSPSGTTVNIYLGPPCAADNVTAWFDDEATIPITCVDNFVGTLIPTSALSAFDGEDVNGTWTLIIEDQYGGDLTYLLDWSIEVSGNSPPIPISNWAIIVSLLLIGTFIFIRFKV